MNKRGQAALEFLMTYGWAILVVLIAIGALAYLVDFQSLLGDRCQVGAPLYCESHKANTTDISIRLKNALPNSITVTSISLADAGSGGCSSTGLTTAMTSGASQNFDITCTSTSGDKIKSKLTVTYNDASGLDGIVKTGQVVVGVA